MRRALNSASKAFSDMNVYDLPVEKYHAGATEIAARISTAHLASLVEKLIACGAASGGATDAAVRIAWEVGDYIFNGPYQEEVSEGNAGLQARLVAKSVSTLVGALEQLSRRAEAILEHSLGDDELCRWGELKQAARRLQLPLSEAAESFKASTGRRLNHNFVHLVKRASIIWRDSTGAWPGLTIRDGTLLSPLYDELQSFVYSLTEDHLLRAPFESERGGAFERGVEAAKGNDA